MKLPNLTNMKNLLFAFLVVCGVAANAADHKFISMLQGPTVIDLAPGNGTALTLLATDSSITATKNVYYTNFYNVVLQANTNKFYYITNTIVGDTNASGWRTGLNTNLGNNAAAFIPVENWADALGDQQVIPLSLTYTKDAATNAIVLTFLKSFDGINYGSTSDNVLLNIATGGAQATPQTIYTNIPTSLLAGVKSLKLYSIGWAANVTSNTVAQLKIYQLGISGFKP